MQTLGDRVREARDRKLWTQRELSEATGIMEATISRIENGKHRRRPYRETLEALSDALDVSVPWLVFGEREGKTLARDNRARAGVPDTGSYPVEDVLSISGATACRTISRIKNP